MDQLKQKSMERINDKAVGCVTGSAIIFGFTIMILYIIGIICKFVL
jgi:hypothetical protein